MEQLPAIPLRNHFILPTLSTSIIVGRKESISSLNVSKLQNNSRVLLIPQIDLNDEVITDPSQFHSIGTLCEILDTVKLPDESIKVHLKGLKIVEVFKIHKSDSFWLSYYLDMNVSLKDTDKCEALNEVLIDNLKRYTVLNRSITPQFVEQLRTDTNIVANIYKILAFIPTTPEDLISLVKVSSYDELAMLVIEILATELEKNRIKSDVDIAVKKKIESIQKKMFLGEQLKEIKKQLDSDNPQKSDYVEKIESIKAIDEKVRAKLLQDVSKLEAMHQSSPEYTVLQNYLDVVTSLPWGINSEFNIDLKHVKEMLDKDHYGLDKVKDKILEQLSVMKLKNENSGSILCLVGPPGVGKSTLAKSIAKSIDRKFVNLSLGGLSDEAELRGHRKTYIGSMPGQIIKKIANCGVSNPVFLFDEIDKMGSNYKGDPSSVLLEILDKEQNGTFTDNYIDIPFDLSKVMFILTANSLNTISQPLLDRVEVIELSSYLYPEKIEIASKYLVPNVLKESGLSGNVPVTFKESGVDEIIKRYTREAGVRQLNRTLETICRKVAKNYLETDDSKRVYITKKSIESYLGKPRFSSKDILSKNSIGNVVGLAWTSVGGAVLFVQASIFKSSAPKFMLTGRMGDVMKESSTIALTVAKKYCEELVPKDFYKTHEIHVHIPDGAVPKDGPSAGITLATALVSVFMNRKIDKTIAMTGELSLVGKVLPIGGLREKLTAAISAGVKKALVPIDNLKDVEELPEYITENIEIVTVSTISEVLDITLI